VTLVKAANHDIEECTNEENDEEDGATRHAVGVTAATTKGTSMSRLNVDGEETRGVGGVLRDREGVWVGRAADEVDDCLTRANRTEAGGVTVEGGQFSTAARQSNVVQSPVIKADQWGVLRDSGHVSSDSTFVLELANHSVLGQASRVG